MLLDPISGKGERKVCIITAQILILTNSGAFRKFKIAKIFKTLNKVGNKTISLTFKRDELFWVHNLTFL